MNTIKLYQAIAHNPGLTVRQLSDRLQMPYTAARRAKDTLAEQKQIEPCGTENRQYKWRVNNR